MQIKTLLEQAARCTTEQEVPALCATIREAFDRTALFSKVKFERDPHACKDEAIVCKVGALVQLRFNHQHSDAFVTSLVVTIDEEGFGITVVTSYCKAGFGNSRYSIEGMEDDFVEAQPHETLDEVLAKVRELAMVHQRKLLEMVGVPENLSADLAEKLW